MKKALLILTLMAGLTLFSSCSVDKSYSSYSMGANEWYGTSNDTLTAAAAQYLIANAYVAQFSIEGDNVDNNNIEALKIYDAKLELLKTTGKTAMEAQLKGTPGSPCQLSFSFLILRSNTDKWVSVKSETITLNIEK